MASEVKPMIIRSPKTIAASRKRVLKKEGVYSPLYDNLIDALSQSLHLKDIAFRDATVGFIGDESLDKDEENEDVGGKSVVFEYSREKDRRYKINPAFSIYNDMVLTSLKLMESLCITAKSANAIQDDDLEILKDKMDKAANG